MIKLVLADIGQITFLETVLMSADIDYETAIYKGEYGIQPPYLLVYGTPLDEVRAIEWIKEHSNNE
jgi:hypothetical protein